MRTLVINDPIHQVMDFSNPNINSLFDIIDHPLFQRLRHIKQLGMGDLVFPGAVHTRFNHSLGAAFLAKRILMQTLPQAKAEGWSFLVTVSALLHDVGHGPFSHAFERLTEETDLTPIYHEDWTSLFLKEILGANSELYFLVNSIVSKSASLDPELLFVSDIISSQVDADRLDYLLRDSHFCGVSYGKYDLNWLMHCMTAITDDNNHLRLGIIEKGVGAVEGFLMARRLMTQNVYHHPTINILQTFMILFLAECCFCIHEPSLQACCPKALKAFLEGLNLYRSKKLNKSEFMQNYFSTYQTLSDYIIYQWIETVVFNRNMLPKKIVRLAERLFYRKLPKLYKIPKHSEETIRNDVSTLRKTYHYETWQLGLQEVKFTTYQDAQESILVKGSGFQVQGNRNKGTKEITQSSFLMNTFANQKESILYLYLDKNLIEETPIKQMLNNAF